MTNLEVVTRALRDANVPYALIGALALAARGASRSALDIDLLTTDRAVLNEDFWTAVRDAGFSVDVRSGDSAIRLQVSFALAVTNRLTWWWRSTSGRVT